jgi:glycosyltransferase involved in cell wall biosynthesis
MGSVTEVNPLTIGESLAAGTPVVAVDSFSAREGMVEGHDGLIAPLDTGAFGHAVRTLLEDVPLRQRMSASARETAERRSSGNAAERTESVYYALMGRGHLERETPDTDTDPLMPPVLTGVGDEETPPATTSLFSRLKP